MTQATSNSLSLQSALSENSALVEKTLEELLDEANLNGEIFRPARLADAMKHSALGGGKRLRPFLLIESAKLFGAEPSESIYAACALELVHCYSLVHDDLPAMDDDDLRRGKPTVHIAFDEATAILAGDSLLTLAFDAMGREDAHKDPAIRAALVVGLARASGLGGMAGGQMLDLMAETDTPDEVGIRKLQAMKTGALIRFACEGGAVFGGAGEKEVERLAEFGRIIGAAFQLADDILDVTSDAKTMGKATAKDADAGKGTLVAMHGLGKARSMLAELIAQAETQLAPFGDKADILLDAAHFIAERDH